MHWTLLLLASLSLCALAQDPAVQRELIRRAGAIAPLRAPQGRAGNRSAHGAGVSERLEFAAHIG